MKICYLTYNLNQKSGWGRYASDLICGIRAKGLEAVVLKEVCDDQEGESLIRRGPFGLLISAIRVRQYLQNCDIVHALDIYPYGVIAFVSRMFSSKKLVITAQGTYAIEPLYHAKTAFLSQYACRSADLIIPISNFTRGELLKKVIPQNIKVISHGVDLSKFYRSRVHSEEKFIISVGALKERKGYHISIPAFALVKEKFPDLKYKVVGSQGDFRYINKLKIIGEKYGVSGDIEFLKEISDEQLIELYQKAKLFVLTSVNRNHSFEGFGLVFLEAAAAGLPLVGTLGNGIEDAVKSGYNGILVEQNDITQTAEAVTQILSDDAKWQRMSLNSYEWAKSHSLEFMVDQYISIYKGLINSS